MAYIRLPLGIRVSVEFTWNGEEVVNIHHVVMDTTPTLLDLTAIGTVIRDWARDNLMPNLSDQCELTGVTALDLNVPNGDKVYVPMAPPEPGNVAGESMPNNVALVCSFYTEKTGRSFRGRAYVPGMAELYVTDNYVNSAVAAEVALTYSELQTLLFVESGTLVVASFFAAGIPRAEGIGTRVRSFATNLRVDTQRRRLPKA